MICHSDAGSPIHLDRLHRNAPRRDRRLAIDRHPSATAFDNAMAESVIGLVKTELHRNPAALARNNGPWRGPTTSPPAEVEADIRHRSHASAA